MGELVLQPRDVRFDWSGLPLCWIPGEPAASHIITLDVPADRSALDVLLDQDRDLPYSCKQGFCGTCTQRVVGGVVDHRDRRLTDAERAAGDILICVSRAAAGERLVLDL